MESNWDVMILNDFVNINPRESISKNTKARKIPMDALGNFTKKIPSYSLEEFKGGTKFRNGDTLLARITPCLENGKTAFVDILDENEIAFGSTEYIILREKKGVSDKNFVYYLSISPILRRVAIQSMTGSSGRQRVQTDVLKNTEFKFPPLPEQKAIAHILGSLDNKIELNRQMNQTLEQMAQALFKSWFVDFDPVVDNALAQGKAIPEEFTERAARRIEAKSKFKALPEYILKFFPSEFELTDEMEWIPKGWKAKTVDELISVNPTTKLLKDTVAPYVDMKALPTEGFSVHDVIQKEFKGGAKYKQGDVLLARITPCLENGKAGVVDFLNEGEVGFGSTEFIVFREKENIKTSYIACLMRLEPFKNHCTQSMVGSSGRQRVQNACFSNYYLAVPDTKEIFKMFYENVDSSFKKIRSNILEIQSLTQQRDTLLPKLISGKLRVGEVETLMQNKD